MSVERNIVIDGKKVVSSDVPSQRQSDKCPHMGKYVIYGVQGNKQGIYLKIEHQYFFIQVHSLSPDEQDLRTVFYRDMLTIALNRLVEIEIEKRIGSGQLSITHNEKPK